MGAEFGLLVIGKICNDPLEPLERVDRPYARDPDVGHERIFVSVEIAGDHLKAVAATQLANHVADAGGRLQDRSDDLDLGKQRRNDPIGFDGEIFVICKPVPPNSVGSRRGGQYWRPRR